MPSMICGGVTGGEAAKFRSVTISGNAGGTAPKSTAMSICSVMHLNWFCDSGEIDHAVHVPVKTPKIGEQYGYHAVAAIYHPRPVGIHFVLVNGEEIVALRVREDFNRLILSSAPQIWVGNSAGQKKWGNTLAGMKEPKHRRPLPLFVKRNGEPQYTYLGDFVVTGSTTDETELRYARQHIKHEYGISLIVSLKRS